MNPNTLQPQQPQKLTIEQFGAKIKEKYPQYAKYPDKMIGEETLVNHPEYKDRIMSPVVANEMSRKSLGSYFGDQGAGVKKTASDYMGRVTDAVGTDIANRVDKVSAIQSRPDSGTTVDKNTIAPYFSGGEGGKKAFQTFGQGAGMAANALEKTVTEVPVVGDAIKKGAEFANEGIDWLATSNASPLKHLGDIIGSSEAVQKMVDKYDTDPSFKDSVDAVANTVRLGGDVDAIVQSANFATNVVDKLLKGDSAIAKPVAPKAGSVEALQEEHYGFKPGMRKVFDDALMKGDKAAVTKLLPDVPEAYKAGLADKIQSVVGAQSPAVAGGSAEATANLMPKATKGVAGKGSVPGNIVKDVVPTAERLVNTEVTKALDLTQGDVKNISLSTGNEVGQFIADKNLIGVNKEATLKNIKDYYKENYDTVRNEIKKVKTTFPPEEIPRYKEALLAVKKQISGTPGLQEANYEITKLLEKPRPTLQDVQRVKELMDDHFSLYKATGDVKEGVAKQGLTEIRKDIKEFIENEVKDNTGVDIRELNKNVQTARSISDAIETRSTRGLTRATISAGDIMTFLTGSGFGSPITGALAVIAKKIYQSPTFKLRFAKFLDDFSDAKKLKIQQDLEKGVVPPELKEIQSSIESTQSNALPNQ